MSLAYPIVDVFTGTPLQARERLVSGGQAADAATASLHQVPGSAASSCASRPGRLF